MSRLLISAGIILVVIGLAWPLFQRLPLGRLPGDILIESKQFRLYLPITTAVIASLVLSLLFWFFKK